MPGYPSYECRNLSPLIAHWTAIYMAKGASARKAGECACRKVHRRHG